MSRRALTFRMGIGARTCVGVGVVIRSCETDQQSFDGGSKDSKQAEIQRKRTMLVQGDVKSENGKRRTIAKALKAIDYLPRQ